MTGMSYFARPADVGSDLSGWVVDEYDCDYNWVATLYSGEVTRRDAVRWAARLKSVVSASDKKTKSTTTQRRKKVKR